MKQKFNEFQNLFETAFTHFSNGGFREGSAVTLNNSFLRSDYCKKHYSGHKDFINFLKQLIKDEVLFFIKRVVAHGPGPDIKNATDNSGAGDTYLVLYTDPRKVQWPSEFNEFTVPGDFEVVSVREYGINLPPLPSVPNKYERPMHSDAKVYKMESKLDNRPQDDSLPTANVKLPFAKEPTSAKYTVKS